MDDQIGVWEAKIESAKSETRAGYKEKMADAAEDKWEEEKDVFSTASEFFREGFNKLKSLFGLIVNDSSTKKLMIMKTLGIMGVLFILTNLSGCKYKNEALELQKQNQDLAIQLAKSDSLSNVYSSIIKDIEAVLDSIIPEDNALDPAPVEKKLRARISQKLNEINGLLLEQGKNYNALNYRLNKSNNLVSEKSAKIEEMNREVAEKESVNLNLMQNINKLEKQIADLSSNIESVIQEKQKLNEELDMKTNSINSAHFIAGSEDELRSKAIIEKTGGFLGFLGRVNTLNPALDRNLLQMIDIREKTTFTLNAEVKKIEFITNHHPASYKLNEASTGTSLLTITDPVEFWKSSKYLVITY